MTSRSRKSNTVTEQLLLFGPEQPPAPSRSPAAEERRRGAGRWRSLHSATTRREGVRSPFRRRRG
jgi:hypothetical protein